MRGDGMAVGDVGAVSFGAWDRRDTAGGDDGRGAGGQRDPGLVGGLSRTEQDAESEPRRHGIGVDDGTRIGHGYGGVYSAGEGGAHGMRGDGLGIGDIDAVPCWAWGRRDTADGDDGRGAGRERDARVVGGHSRAEQDAASEPRWHGIGVDDGTRIEDGGCSVHNAGSGGAHGMRGDGMGVGDVCAVSCGARVRRVTAVSYDCKFAGRERDAGVVD
jgi:hypothetical protein